MPICKWTVLLAVVGFCYVQAASAVELEGNSLFKPVVDFTRQTLEIEAQITNTGGTGFFDPAVPAPIKVEQVIADWKKNIISASKKYQSNTSRVQFKLNKFSLSSKGFPVLEAEVPRKPLPDTVQFEFPNIGGKDMDYLGGLNGGEDIQVVCSGKVNVLGSPGGPDAPGLAGSILTFKNCQMISSVLSPVYGWFTNALTEWESGTVDADIATSPKYKALLEVIANSYDAVKIIPKDCRQFYRGEKNAVIPADCKKALSVWRDSPTSDEAKAFVTRNMPSVNP